MTDIELRAIAKKIGKRNHAIAHELWSSGIHEARLLASMIDDPKLVTEEQMEDWVNDFNSWDICVVVTFLIKLNMHRRRQLSGGAAGMKSM